jgi:hypothetical protein
MFSVGTTWLFCLVKMRLVEEERVHHLVAHLVGQNLRHLEQEEF